MTNVAVLGAGGKMGIGISKQLMGSEFDTVLIEPGDVGIQRLRDNGFEPTPADEALPQADVAILAVPDTLIARIGNDVAPKMKPGATMILLDAAVAYTGKLSMREDIGYFMTHPTHKSPFLPKEHQSLMCVLIQGNEEQYGLGERVARRMYHPVGDAHRLTLEQMMMLEPAIVETLGVAFRVALNAAMEEAFKRGVPEEAALDFITGHISVAVGVLRRPGKRGWMSDGALLIGDWGYKRIFRDDWKQILSPEGLREQAEIIDAGTYEGREELARDTINQMK